MDAEEVKEIEGVATNAKSGVIVTVLVSLIMGGAK